jgi:hypothetical protein
VKSTERSRSARAAIMAEYPDPEMAAAAYRIAAAAIHGEFAGV